MDPADAAHAVMEATLSHAVGNKTEAAYAGQRSRSVDGGDFHRHAVRCIRPRRLCAPLLLLIAYNPHPHGSPRGPELERTIADAMGAGLGWPFRPKRQLFVSDLPKTRNTKILRRVVKALVTGGDPGDLAALFNPDSTRGAQPDLGPLAWGRA